ncbi:hypothetical protein O181_123487 [Austropuccinia psidii MF-1]|uniref:Uncharacterized protein n=1 Tax=Austropuccinia psidii MF-1 TaxID=1389203 RepID=A0A9Q3KQ53_9BASI|nr:hypothetical protein [Austropuccinia psidii MF-1]
MPELPPVPKDLNHFQQAAVEIYQSQWKNWFLASKQQEWELLPSNPSVLVLEIGTSELEYMGLPPAGIGPQTLVHLATSLCLEPVTTSKYWYQFNQDMQITHIENILKFHQEWVLQRLGIPSQKAHPFYSINAS